MRVIRQPQLMQQQLGVGDAHAADLGEVGVLAVQPEQRHARGPGPARDVRREPDGASRLVQ